jgi:DNA mismatch repair ATPase MutS
VIDELLVSTNYAEGLSGAASILQNIGLHKFAHTICITHYHALTQLPHITNYHFSNSVSSSGDVHYNYKLLHGPNTQLTSALSIMKANGVAGNIIKSAEEYYKRLQD